VRAGRVDVIVVYEVDRLTRSLAVVSAATSEEPTGCLLSAVAPASRIFTCRPHA
jgi:hypothetical protein